MGIGSEHHRLQILDLIEAKRGDRAPAIARNESRKAVEIVRSIYLPFRHHGNACAAALGG